MSKNAFPPGWDEARVERLLSHYEKQSEEEAVAEDEATLANKHFALMEVPHEIVPAVRKLIAKHKKAKAS